MKKEKPNIKVLVAVHKKFPLLPSKIFVPIHAGRKVAEQACNFDLADKDIEWLKNIKLGDNTGDNISQFNRNLCEMTATYWAWKHQDELGNPDYIGINHYRRHFIYNKIVPTKSFWLTGKHAPIYIGINNRYKKMTDPKALYKIFEKYDLVTGKKHNLRGGNSNYKTTCDRVADRQMAGEEGRIQYKKMEEIIRERHPEYIPYFEEMDKTCEHYLCNLIITKKEIFNEYCEFVFDILLQLVDEQDTKNSMFFRERRVQSYISEFVSSIFIQKYKHDHPDKVKELEFTYVLDKHSYEKFFKKLKKFLIWYFKH